MAIDNVYDAIDKQYPEDDGNVVVSLAKFFGVEKELAIPTLPGAAQFFSFLASKYPKARIERVVAFLNELVPHIQNLDAELSKMRTDIAEVKAAAALALEYDAEEFDDAKRARYISIVTRAIASETKVNDVVSFVQDVERLGERDIIGLKVVNVVMNQEGDWQDPPGPPQLNVPRLHPNNFTRRTQDLVLGMAHALGNSAASDVQPFSREDGLQVCLRLQGFGLAHLLSGDTREVPISNYCARPTTRGLMLLKLLGENVPNWNRYFGPDGAL
jgi:hypothetical protein